MKTKAVFYHAGCPVCVAGEQHLVTALDPARLDVEIVHLGQSRARLTEAERAGVRSVPTLVLDGAGYHLNFGVALEALKEALWPRSGLARVRWREVAGRVGDRPALATETFGVPTAWPAGPVGPRRGVPLR